MLFDKLNIKFLSKILKKEPQKTDNSNSLEYSRFREFLFFSEGTDEENDNIALAVELCDDSLKLEKHKKIATQQIKNLNEILDDIDCYNKLSKDEAEKFKKLINKFIQLNADRRNLMLSLSNFNDSINALDTLKEDAQNVIDEMLSAEEEERILYRDLEIIKQEQNRTILDRERLEFAYKFVYRFCLIISSLLSLSIIVLSFMSLFNNQSVFMPLTILFFIIVIIVTVVFIIRRKIVFELKLNEKKQAKIMSLLNKKKVIYAHYVNFLNFAYSKYKVKSARILKENLDKYNNYKNTINRYDKLGKILFETQRNLEEFMDEKQIELKNTSLEAFAKSINVDNKIAYSNNLNNKKLELEKKLESIKSQQEEMWEKLVYLNTNDTTEDNIIEQIMNAYLNELEKIKLDVIIKKNNLDDLEIPFEIEDIDNN